MRMEKRGYVVQILPSEKIDGGRGQRALRIPRLLSEPERATVPVPVSRLPQQSPACSFQERARGLDPSPHPPGILNGII